MVAACRSGMLVVAILAFWLAPITAMARDDAFTPTHQVSADKAVIVRSDPSLESTAVATVAPMTELELLDEQADGAGTVWVEIRTSDGSTGWIRAIDVSTLTDAVNTLPETGTGEFTRAFDPGLVGLWAGIAVILLVAAFRGSRRTG
jgi:uncharacterized protein YgiM (DUF1202 family)